MNKNNFTLGLLLGLISPIIGFLIYYLWKFYPTYGLDEYWQVISQQRTLLTGISSFSLVVSAVFFTYFVNKQLDQTAKGIFIITIIISIVILVYKMFIN